MAVARTQESREAGAVTVAVALGDDRRGQRSSERLFARPAEERLGLSVPLDHAAVRVDADDGDERAADHRAQARLRCAQPLLRGDSLDGLPDLRPDRGEEAQQLVVRGMDLAVEELEHPEEPLAAAHGNAEGAVQIVIGRGCRAGKVGVCDDVWHPDGLAPRPDPTGKPDAWREARAAADLFERARPLRVSAPQVVTADEAAALVDHPKSADLPSERAADLRQDAP